MILDTFPLAQDTQQIDKFGFGWHGLEPHLFGVGGRWTSGSGKAYFYTRLEAESLALRFRSPFHSATKFRLLLSARDPITKAFTLERDEEFFGEKDRMVELEFPVELRANCFYRLALLSPTFSPKELYGFGDARRLGLAVASMQLRGRPHDAQSDLKARLDVSERIRPASPDSYQFPILG